MPTSTPPAAVAQLLVRPCHATISCLRASGQPVSVPTWYLYEEGRIVVSMDARRQRLAWLRNDPRTALSVLDPDDWVTHVSIQGHVTDFVDDPDLADIDRIARHYTSEPYPVRSRPRVTALVAIDRWHAWGRLRNA